MKSTVRKSSLVHGWLLNANTSIHRVRLIPPTEPRNLSCDPAFGDFNLPLDDNGGSSGGPTDDAGDVSCMMNALEADEFESYSEFRRGELGL